MLRMLGWAAVVVVVSADPVIGLSVGQTAAAPQRVSLKLASCSLREVARQISERSGVNVSVEDRIAGWKATIAYHGAPEALLEAICHNFRLRAERSAQPRSADALTPSYRLVLDPDEVERLDALAARRKREAAERSRRDAVLMMRTIQELVDHPDHRVRMTEEGPMSPLARGAEPLLDLVGSMGSAFLSRVVQSVRREMPDCDKSATAVVPMSAMSPAQRALVRSYLENSLSMLRAETEARTVHEDNLVTALQRLDGARIGFWTLNDGMSQDLHMSVYTPGLVWAPDCRIVCSGASEGSPPEPARAKSVPATAADPRSDARTDLVLDNRDYSTAALELARSCGVHLVADAFCLRSRIQGRWLHQPRKAVLDGFCSRLKLLRQWRGDVLLLRAEDWEGLLSEEPPTEVLDLLGRALDESGRVTLDDMADAAARMERSHVAGLCRWRSPKGILGVSIANLLGTRFAVWKWLGGVRPTQRRALADGGLRARDLSPAQRTSLVRLAAESGLPAPSDGAVLGCLVDRPSVPKVILGWLEPGAGARVELR